MPINWKAMERRKARDGEIAAALGTPPHDPYGSLKLRWVCTDVDSHGTVMRYEAEETEWEASGSNTSWYAAYRGMYARGVGNRHRRFHSARAACKFIEDTKLA